MKIGEEGRKERNQRVKGDKMNTVDLNKVRTRLELRRRDALMELAAAQGRVKVTGDLLSVLFVLLAAGAFIYSIL